MLEYPLMNKSIRKLQTIDLAPSSPIKFFVWRTRRGIRNLFGRDILKAQNSSAYTTAREMYVKFDKFLVSRLPGIEHETSKEVAMRRIRDILEHELHYKFADIDEKRPWGGYYRIVNDQADRFIQEFFPGLSLNEAKFGRKNMELSPKILVVCPRQRLSWQYHDKRAERWRFLTPGGYYRSHSNTQGTLQTVEPGTVVQFATGERHRLCAGPSSYTIVAEIWQHTDPDNPSDESDIVRLQDDYKR